MLDVAAVLEPPLQLFLALLKNATRTLETSKMESFATIVNGLKAANYCSKPLHLKRLRGLAYTSAPLNQTTKALFNTYHFFPTIPFLCLFLQKHPRATKHAQNRDQSLIQVWLSYSISLESI